MDPTPLPDPPARPAEPAPPNLAPEAAARRAREAAALRANLRKRKDQARARQAPPPAQD
ncbi:MAG: hypothetical protein HIU82_18340 [Proteobacteria bacterium]|nr:hypothetical protein [Pseudomonadota bacterium]